MLAGATRWLADRSETTLLIARRASRFAPGDRRFVPLDADWTAAGFQADLEGALRAARPIDQALLWLHEPEPILPWLLPLLPEARVVLVLGSLDGQPEIPGAAAKLVTVRLGSKPTATGGRRWLTDEEISEGAILALESDEAQVVGELSGL
jgi:hypothetical protein